MMRRMVLSAALAAVVAAPVHAESPDCSLTIKSAFRMDLGDDGLVRVPVLVDRRPFKMIIDTGAYATIVSGYTADALKSKIQPTLDLVLIGWGGWMTSFFIEAKQFSIGRMGRDRTNLMVAYSLPETIDGVIGADYLYYFDLDFDFAKAQLNLISPDRCEGKAVYWTQGAYGKVPFKYQHHDINLRIMLDGKPVNAVLDTGSNVTVMSLEEANGLFGGSKPVEGWSKDKFKTMSFGAVTVNNPQIKLVSDKHSKSMGGAGPQMILGMDIMRRLHLYISYKEETIYVTPATQY
jgi:predicted aspartyl protease